MGPTVAPAQDAGFTLVELLVVVAILSVLTVAATLSVATPAGGPSRDAARLQARYAALQDAAILSGRPQGLRLGPDGLASAHLLSDGTGWDLGRPLRWDGAASLTLDKGGATGGSGSPNILFLPSGQTTGFAVRFTRRNDVTLCRTDGWSGLACDTR